MFDFINYTADKTELFILIILRLSGVFLLAPVWSHRFFPTLAKVGFVIILALILVGALGNVSLPQIQSVWELAGLAVKELLVGVIIGLCFQMIFWGAQTAGSLTGYQLGLTLANELDADMSEEVSVIGTYWHLIALLIFLTIDGHHLVITALVDSYQAIAPGAMHLSGGVTELIIKYSGYVFVVGLKIAAPVMVTLFLTDVAMGTIAKTMPTMNVFFVGFPVKIAVGLAVMALSLPAVAYVLEKSATFMDHELRLMLASMGKA